MIGKPVDGWQWDLKESSAVLISPAAAVEAAITARPAGVWIWWTRVGPRRGISVRKAPDFITGVTEALEALRMSPSIRKRLTTTAVEEVEPRLRARLMTQKRG